MSSTSKRPRLDEILVRAKLLTPEQVQQALIRQKANGGKLGSHLLYCRFIDEAGLVKALAIQFNCEGVVVSKLNIPQEIVNQIPAKVAISRKVIPFDFDSGKNLLKIACENPTDKDLINELGFVTNGKNIKLFVAAELCLETAVARHYQGKNISLGNNLSFEIPDTATDTGKTAIVTDQVTAQSQVNELLLVTDERYSGPLLKSLFEWDGFKVTITDSADDAIELIDEHSFHTVFIKDTVTGDYLDLIDRLRKISPRTVVRYFETTSSLLLNEGDLAQDSRLYYMNLDLFTSVIASRDKQIVNHSGRVGRYATRLCSKLGLPHKERISVATAAYFHDLAKFYYNDPAETDVRVQVAKTAKLLQSINYPPVIIQMLLSMYKDLEGKFTKRLPIEVLGGNILTVVDLFCASINPEQKLSLDRFEVVRRKLKELTGRLFLAEIAEAFILMIQEEILNSATSCSLGQIMILGDKSENIHPVELHLRNEGFRVVCETSQDIFAEMFERSVPDILLVISTARPDAITKLIEKVVNPKSVKAKVPVFLLVKEYDSAHLSATLGNGVEDIISLDNNLDILVAKIRRIVAGINEKAARKDDLSEASGATGRISNMSLIDLLQAMGPGQKTVKITVTSLDKNQKLEMFLGNGKIIYAAMGDLRGAEAVYEAMSWSDGVWNLEPMEPENLPAPNNTLPNESILMEGCRLLDEKHRAVKAMSK